MAKLEAHTIFNTIELTVVLGIIGLIIYTWIEFLFVLGVGAAFLLTMDHLEKKEKREKARNKQKKELKVVVEQIEREKNGLP